MPFLANNFEAPRENWPEHGTSHVVSSAWLGRLILERVLSSIIHATCVRQEYEDDWVGNLLVSSLCVDLLPCTNTGMSTMNPASNGNGVANGISGKKTFFLDIDNCLYPKSYQIHEHMSELIDDYFQTHLSLSKADATELHQRYYKDYGLAIEGLVRHHKVDPLEYNRKVDDALPLEDIIKPNPKLRKLLEDIDLSKVKLWLFTNAYKTHGERVVRLLEIADLFEGMTYCDYGAPTLLCKPAPQMFAKAMREAGAQEVKDCYFVDDSALNVEGGTKYGWKTAHLVEPTSKAPEKQMGHHQITDLEELRTAFPELFKSS